MNENRFKLFSARFRSANKTEAYRFLRVAGMRASKPPNVATDDATMRTSGRWLTLNFTILSILF